MTLFKKQLYTKCVIIAEKKRNDIAENIMRVQESLTSESKSTAGDKHETGRAMLQLEREKLGLQLKNAEQISETLKRINPEQENVKVVLGSYVETDKGNYYLSAFLGEIIIEEIKIFTISAQSPIGKLILGKYKNDTFQFNGGLQTIISIS